MIIHGKVGIMFAKPNLRKIRLDEKSKHRIIGISTTEANAVNTLQILKNFESSNGINKSFDEERLKRTKHWEVAKETYMMVDDFIKLDS